MKTKWGTAVCDICGKKFDKLNNTQTRCSKECMWQGELKQRRERYRQRKMGVLPDSLRLGYRGSNRVTPDRIRLFIEAGYTKDQIERLFGANKIKKAGVIL